jgi:predicted naringenin-chalcone synthase
MNPICSLGTALPELSISQQDVVEHGREYSARTEDEARLLKIIYRRSGVERRSMVTLDPGPPRHPSFFPVPRDAEDRGPSTAARMDLFAREAPALAHRAAHAALQRAGVEPGSIDQLVTVSCTGFGAPGFDLALVKSLELRPTTGRTHVGFMGCHGALNGLRVASGYVRGGIAERVLVCATELSSVHFQYGWDPDRVVGNSLFSDGAAALVVEAAPAAHAAGPHLRLMESRSWILPESEDALTWRIGNNGFVMTLSAQVPEHIRRHLARVLVPWLGERGLRVEDVKRWAVHPGGPRVLTSVSEALGLPETALAASRAVLSEHGNMSSPTVLFVLERLLREGAGGPTVALGFGPGLTAEAALFL